MQNNTLKSFLDELASQDVKYKTYISKFPKVITAQLLPIGWMTLAQNFFIEFYDTQDDWMIHEFKEDWGSLSIQISAIDRKKVISEQSHSSLILHYYNLSQKTCMHCGEHGKRHIRNNRILVSCSKHKNINLNTLNTGTWLDKY
jgi:hypothetical protein